MQEDQIDSNGIDRLQNWYKHKRTS
jgi:hypothetical protein